MTFHIWEGVYPSFADAPGKVSVTGEGDGGFEGSQWLEKSVRRAVEARDRMRSPRTIKPAALARDYVLPVVAALAHSGDRPLSVLDFGGGLAISYFGAEAALPAGRSLVFHCLESEALRREASALFTDYPDLHFHSEFATVPKPVDVVHAGSSLQYVEDWRGVLGLLCGFAPRYLVLADIPASDLETFVSIQNYYERHIRHWFWNIGEFVAAVEANGYQLLYRSNYQGVYLGREGPYPMDNFPPERQLGHSCQMVFRKIGA
ncbi:MAG: methyltransferase, TIGR04325 family [Alphaproteobacteria bacterium]